MDRVIADIAARADRAAVPAQGLWNQSFIELAELRNLLDAARAVTAAARERDAGVGGHVRLDRPDASVFSAPYSTVVRRDAAGAFVARRALRPRTPLRRLVAMRLKDAWRKTQNKLLRRLPDALLDRILEKRYRAILGPANAAPAIQPGSPAGAVAEAAE